MKWTDLFLVFGILTQSREVAYATEASACLITRSESNPYFVKMRGGAQAKADELGVRLSVFAGRVEGDVEGQIAALQSCIADGVSGILLVPSDSVAVVDTVKQARDNGILVIALDTPLDPIDAADATFAADNFRAGELIGFWAKTQLGDQASNAKIAYLDLMPGQLPLDVLRDQGFMYGFGIDLGDPEKIGDESDDRNVCHDVTNGNPEGGRRAMENCLQKAPDIDVVYTINESVAAGAYEALRAVGREKDVILVSLEGSCSGVQNISQGMIGATSQQYPQFMGSMGIEAIKKFADSGEKPNAPTATGLIHTAPALVTSNSVAGLPPPSIRSEVPPECVIDPDLPQCKGQLTPEEALQLCWG